MSAQRLRDVKLLQETAHDRRSPSAEARTPTRRPEARKRAPPGRPRSQRPKTEQSPARRGRRRPPSDRRRRAASASSRTRLDEMIVEHARERSRPSSDADSVPARLRLRPRLAPRDSAPSPRPSSTPRASSSRPTSTCASGAAAAMRNRSEEVDEFGYDPIYEQHVRPLFDFLYKQLLPRRGPRRRRRARERPLPARRQPLGHAAARRHDAQDRGASASTRSTATCAGSPRTSSSTSRSSASFANRLGAVRACQENAERLLRHEDARRRVPRGHQGHRQALSRALPAPALRARRLREARACARARRSCRSRSSAPRRRTRCSARVESLAKPLGIPYLPVTPTFPLLGPLGLLPAPTKWKIVFGEPIDRAATGPRPPTTRSSSARSPSSVRGDDPGDARRRSAASGSSRLVRMSVRARGPAARSSSTSRAGRRATTSSRRLRRALGTRAVGHAGTLDPMATGVLVVAVGEATKLVPWLDGARTRSTRRPSRSASRPTRSTPRVARLRARMSRARGARRSTKRSTKSENASCNFHLFIQQFMQKVHDRTSALGAAKRWSSRSAGSA